jgi:TusA-related sulfurtransferase
VAEGPGAGVAREHGEGGQGDVPGPPAAAAVRTIDCIGLFCPVPVLKLAEAMREVAVGDRVDLLADDPAAKVDVRVWCRTRDQAYLGATDRPDGGWVFSVRRAV